MGRPSNTDQRRQQITRGLMMVMAKKGFDGSSTADIARAARLTTGLVHYHFKDKLEILHALAEHLSQEDEASLRRHLEPLGERPAESLGAIIDFYLGLGAAKPNVLACWISLGGEALRHKRIAGVFAATLERLQRLVRERIEAGVRLKVFRADVDADAAAAALVATIQGYFVLAGTARTLIPRGSAARTVKQMMAGLLGASL
jgi:TetR/AcrR family transcriptional repressor of bet genes